MKLETRQAVSMIFRGDTFNHISEKYDCTRQTVGNRWKDFEKKVLEVGLMEAANENGVLDEVNMLRTIARNIARKEASLDDCLTGSNVNSHLFDLGYDVNDLESFLVGLTRYAESQEISGEQLGSLAHKLHLESIQSGLGYADLVETVKTLHNDKTNNEKTIKEQKKTIKQTQQEIEVKLRESEVTDEKLNKYLADKAILENEDLRTEDIEKTGHFIKELKTHEYDSTRVKKLVNKHDSINKQITDLEATHLKLVEDNNRIKAETQGLHEQVELHEARIQILTKQQEKLKEPIEAVTGLFEKQVYCKDIVALKMLIDRADVSFEELKATVDTLGSLKAVREEQKKKNEEYESQSTLLENKINDFKRDIAVLMDRKDTLHNDVDNILLGFDLRLKSITGNTVEELEDPETGIKANVIRTVEQSLTVAEEKVSQFEKESTTKMDQMIEKAEITNTRISMLEEKISRYRVELGQYKSLENLSKLFLGGEVPRGTKLLIVSSTLELLENALNYEGLRNEANTLRQVKENVFRRG